ncbi:MAG: efflux RND transporter permease subunit [Saprospiraceae bacterium]|nr:efflux RND transporter permease subunit [Saprospiraceae bacterium]
MLNHIIRFSLKNRLFVLVCSTLLIAFGMQVASQMEVDVLPDLTAPTVVVLTEAHGMAPEEVERLVSFPIETALNGATGVRRVRSSSSMGISIVWVEFDWGTDIFRARQTAAEKLSALARLLPEDADQPVLAPQSSIMGEIMLVGLTADSTSPMDLRSIADWTIRPRLLAAGGVAQVAVMGGNIRQYQVLASPLLMKRYGVSWEAMEAATRGINGNAAGGIVNEYGNEYIVRGMSRTNDLEELGRTAVSPSDRGGVRLNDVARIVVGTAPRIGDASLNAQPSVILTVVKQPSTNTLELTKIIDTALAELQKTLPADVQIHSHIFRQADFIEASISNIKKTLYEGSLFVVVVLFLFLMNWRATAISLLAIPISLIVAMLSLKWLGYTINTMSLGGMAIAIGALVDDAIIDVENVYRRLRQNALLAKDQRKASLQVVFDATLEIRPGILLATVIIIVAFLPLFFLSGMEGRLLTPLGISFIVSLFSSLVVSITLTPVLGSFLLAHPGMLERHPSESWLVERLQTAYHGMLYRVMLHRKVTLAGSALILCVALVALMRLGRSFLPEFNEGSLVISAMTLPGISLDESKAIGNQIEQMLLEVPEIRSTTRRTGRAELDEHAQGSNGAEIDAPFVLDRRSRSEFYADVRERLTRIPGVNASIGQPIGHRIDHMLSGTKANIAIKIFGPDLPRLAVLSNEIRIAIEDLPGIVDLNVEPQIEIPQLQIRPHRDMLAHYGLPLTSFNKQLELAFSGTVVSAVYEGDRNHDLVLIYDETARGSAQYMREALFDVSENRKVPLQSLADVVSASGPNTVQRENVQRKTVVSANVTGRDQRSAVEDIRRRIAERVVLPENYRIEYGGQFEAEEAASRTLLLTSMLALLAIFLLLYMEFGNLRNAGIVLLNLPLALIGGVASLWVGSEGLSIPAIIGFITLFGIATRNGILLVSRYGVLESEGLDPLETVMRGSVERLSPILMTALTAGLALVPLALAGDLPGNEIQSPMARVILGGLLTSTALNLFVIPLAYSLTHRNKAHANS